MLNFANFARQTQSWYVAARTASVREGRIRSENLLNRRIALFRDRGVVRALDARCPHLGADLGEGTIVDGDVQCAFHHWRFGPDGRCRSAPGHASAPQRCVRSYPVEERWGLVWIFNGPEPLFPLAPPVDLDRFRIWTPRPRHIRCHPHLVVGNGLDVRHLDTLHGMQLTAEPEWSAREPYGIAVKVQGRPRKGWLRRLTGSAQEDVRAEFATTGGNLAWATIERPLRFHALFTGQPVEDGCRTQLVLFLPRGIRAVAAMALLGMLLVQDRRILDTLNFAPAWADGDEPLRAMADAVNRMPVW